MVSYSKAKEPFWEDKSWKWEAVWDPKVKAGKMEWKKRIYYYILYVSMWGDHNEVWERVQQLTKRSKLGYHSAKSPDIMTEGAFEGYGTISLDLESETQIDQVFQTIKKYGLRKHLKYLKLRKRYFAIDENGNPYQKSSKKEVVTKFY